MTAGQRRMDSRAFRWHRASSAGPAGGTCDRVSSVLDVAQAFPVGQLGEGLGIARRKRPDPTAIPVDGVKVVHGRKSAERTPVFMSISSEPEKCSIQFKSTPCIFASNPAEILALKSTAVNRTAGPSPSSMRAAVCRCSRRSGRWQPSRQKGGSASALLVSGRSAFTRLQPACR